MTRWLVEFEIETHIALRDNGPLEFTPSDGSYQLRLRNLDVRPGIERPLLRGEVVLEASEPREAEDQAIYHLKRFLYTLAVVSRCRCNIHRLVRVMDWSPGLDMRPGIMYHEFPDPNMPIEVLDSSLVGTISTLMQHPWDEDLFQAVRWFARAVSSHNRGEQFSNLWFALEILAERKKRSDKVPSTCPQCRGPLYCPACNKIPLHKPYPKQAIQDLINAHTHGEAERVFPVLDSIRNALFHGDDSEDIARQLQVDFQQWTDTLVNIVWAALISSFILGPGLVKLPFLHPSTLAHFYVRSEGHIAVGAVAGSDPAAPRIEDYPLPNVELKVTRSPP